MGKFDRLFEPIQIGPVTVRNRIFQPAHCNGYGEGDRHACFRAEKAKGGFGLLVTESASVHPSSDNHPANQLDMSRLSVLGEHKKMTEAAHAHGAKYFCQLWHGGVQMAGYNNAHGTKNPAWGPSAIQDILHLGQCKEMEEEDIQELIEAFGRSAGFAKLAGYDGVQVHGAHGYLVHQFLSPFYNKRTDRWGGSLENRARFLREVLTSVRKSVEKSIAVSVRLTIDEMLSVPGLDSDDVLQILIMLNDLVDFWDLDIGIYESGYMLFSPARTSPENYQIETVSEMRSRLYDAVPKHTPVGGCGRIRTPDDALRMIEEDQLDMVGMVRQSIADPHWPNKVREERIEDIRECMACNNCIATWLSSRPLACATNPTAGEEYRGLFPEELGKTEEEKMILVVGGGVTGMEVAYVAASRGHSVHLYEEKKELGGHTAMLAKLPGCDQWNRSVEWREHMIRKTGVKVMLESRLSPDDILQYGADDVVFAPGAAWDREGVNVITKMPIAGSNLPHVLVPEDILMHGKEVGDSVLIVDCDGYLMAVGLAEMLGQQDKRVSLVSFPTVGYWLNATMELTTVMQKLYGNKVEIIRDQFVFAISEDGAVLSNLYSGENTARSFDTILLVTRRLPATHDYTEVKARKNEAEVPMDVHLTGEAISPKSFYSMPRPLYWAHTLGRKL